MRTISIAIAVLFGASLGVHAQPAPAPAPVSAEDLFRQGKQLMKEGRYVDACAKFEASERLEPSIGAQLNLGDCHAKLGQTATARLLFLKAAASSRASGDAEREAEANRQAAALEPSLSYLTITATPETRALAGLVVNLDGGMLPLTAIDVPVPVDPGEHTVSAAATKYTPWQGKIVIAAGQRSIGVAIPRLVAIAAPRPMNPGEAELVAQAIAAHQADVAQYGGGPVVAPAPAVAPAPTIATAPVAPAPVAPAPVAPAPAANAPTVATTPVATGPTNAAAPTVVATAPDAAAAPDVTATPTAPAAPEVLDPNWSSEIGNRPLITPKGKIEIHNGLPIFAQPTYDATTGARNGTFTNEAIGVGATFGVIDRLEIGADAMQVLGTTTNAIDGTSQPRPSAFSVSAAYSVLRGGPIDLVVDADFAFITTGAEMPGARSVNSIMGLGVGLRYRINNMFSLFTGRNGAPTMPLPVDFFNDYQASIGLDVGQPITIHVPVGFAVQATPNIYASVALTLAGFRVNDPTSAGFIGVDAYPVSVGAYYSTRAFDVGFQFMDDLMHAGDTYAASLAFRYYVH